MNVGDEQPEAVEEDDLLLSPSSLKKYIKRLFSPLLPPPQVECRTEGGQNEYDDADAGAASSIDRNSSEARTLSGRCVKN